MEVEVVPTKTFEVRIDGKSLGEFKNRSEWEGFMKLVNSKGDTIIVSKNDGSFTKMFNDIFNPDTPAKAKVIKASLDLFLVAKELEEKS